MDDARLAAAEAYLISLIIHTKTDVELDKRNGADGFRTLLGLALGEWARGLKGNVPWAIGMHWRSYVDLLTIAYTSVVGSTNKGFDEKETELTPDRRDPTFRGD